MTEIQTFDEQLQKIIDNLRALEVRSSAEDKRREKSDRKLDKLAKLYGGMSRNLGKAAEQFFFNALKKEMTFAGKDYDIIEKNVGRATKKYEGEFDIILSNHDSIVLFEVKHHVHPNDLQKLITKRLEEFRNLFPEYKGHKIFLAVAGMAFDERVQEDAKAAGVAVLKQQGKVMICDTENMKEF